MKSDDIQHLYSLRNEYRSLRYDLRNIEALSDALGNPHRDFRSVLIAGTNGKGSVARWLSAIVPEAGLFTSPHLVRLNERVSIGSCPIGDDDLDEVFDIVAAAARRAAPRLLYPPTYFELVTAMAFTYFGARVEKAVLEVGLGGRLDATNLVRQDASVITNIGLDHTEYLGERLSQIAAEKAGIIKDTEPVIIGAGADFDCVAGQARGRLVDASRVATEVRNLGGGFLEVDLQTPVRDYCSLRPRIPGRHQVDNLVVAVRTAECLESQGWPIDAGRIANGVNRATWPGRLEKLDGTPPFLLDGGHNVAAAAALARFLAEYYPEGVWLVFGSMREKDHAGILDLIRPHTREIVLTRTANARSVDPVELVELSPRSVVTASVGEAIEYVRDNAPGDATVLVAGSLYLVGEAREALGIDE